MIRILVPSSYSCCSKSPQFIILWESNSFYQPRANLCAIPIDNLDSFLSIHKKLDHQWPHHQWIPNSWRQGCFGCPDPSLGKVRKSVMSFFMINHALILTSAYRQCPITPFLPLQITIKRPTTFTIYLTDMPISEKSSPNLAFIWSNIASFTSVHLLWLLYF